MKINKYLVMMAVALVCGFTLTACGDDDDKNDPKTPSTDKYSDKSYGNAAMDACDDIVAELVKANKIIEQSKLSSEQEAYLRDVLASVVDNVIVPTYTKLADDVEDLEKTLSGLSSSTITQAQIDRACTDFKNARRNWERSEAFLGGAASDFSIDPTIDSWPLDRSELLGYFRSGMTAEIEEESSILGFHALEFILFRNGQNRKAAELSGNDTYVNFTSVSGADELKYAQQVCTLLKQRCFQLQVSWEGETAANKSRLNVVKSAGLDYTTENGLSYGQNLKLAGTDPLSTFPTLTSAIAQVLSDDEGSCVAICDEVGTAKIANPFANADIAYVESPYSYNSITDFSDNIRSIQNVWFASTEGKATSGKSFHNFFASTGDNSVNTAVENAVSAAITAIEGMPAPFVKYCSVVWGKDFDDPDNWDSITEEEE